MEYTVTANEWHKAQSWYINQLAEFFDIPPTPAMMEAAKRKLAGAHYYMRQRETALVWKIPPIVVEERHKFSFTVEPDLASTPIRIV